MIVRLLFALALLGFSTAQAQNTDCGVERWSVKVLTGSDTSSVAFAPVASSIHEQVTLPVVSPGSNDARRSDEQQVYQLSATIIKYKLEDDGDIHLVIYDPNTRDTMVAEIPNPDCPTVQGTSFVTSYRAAREWVMGNIGTPRTSFHDTYTPVTLTGVGYYDPPHGQVGKAPNNREIHPVLAIAGAASVDSDVTSDSFVIYPNPAQTLVHVAGADGIVEIVNAAGSIVVKTKLHDINIRSLPNGEYFVRSTGVIRKLKISR